MKRYIFMSMVMAFMIGVFITGMVPSAHAAFILTLTQGSTQVTIVDDSASDFDNPSGPHVPGQIIWIGGIGVFNINVTVGLSKPNGPNTSLLAYMDLNSITTSTGPGTLTIELTDTDFILPLIGISPAYDITSDIGGTVGNGVTSNSLTYTKYYDPTNAGSKTAIGVQTLSMGPFNPRVLSSRVLSGAFSDTLTKQVIAVNPFALIDVVTITHNKADATSFNAASYVTPVVPEPGTLILLGAGLVGLAGYGKVRLNRRKK